MKKKIIILVALLLTAYLKINAEEVLVPLQPVFTGDSECDRECQPHQTMKNLVEGRVANVACLQTCQQRKVWEKLAISIADVADSLKKNSYKEVLVPMEMKLDELKDRMKSIEKKMGELEPSAKETPSSK